MAVIVQSLAAEHVRFNASEVLEIAEQIKCNAAGFYHNAVDLFADLEIRNLLFELADQQAKYEKAFADIRKLLFHHDRKVRNSEFEYYSLPNVHAMASLSVFGVGEYPPRWQPSGCENKQEILREAIYKEMDVIVFLRG